MLDPAFTPDRTKTLDRLRFSWGLNERTTDQLADTGIWDDTKNGGVSLFTAPAVLTLWQESMAKPALQRLVRADLLDPHQLLIPGSGQLSDGASARGFPYRELHSSEIWPQLMILGHDMRFHEAHLKVFRILATRQIPRSQWIELHYIRADGGTGHSILGLSKVAKRLRYPERFAQGDP